jgi:hypothetical protein
MATVPASTRSTAFTTVSTTAGPFNIGFRLFDTDSLDVYLNGARTTAFTISATFLDGFTDSATLTLNTAVGSGTRVVIDGALTPRREADYLPGDAGLTAKLNIELSRLWSALAEVKRDTERSVRGLIPIEASEEITVGLTVDAVTSAAEAAASAAQAALYEGPWLDDAAAVLANTSLGYAAAGGNLVVAGDYIQARADAVVYRVAASGASDHDVTTAGGVKLYVVPQNGCLNVKAFGAKGDGITDDTAALLKAYEAACLVKGTVLVPAGTYISSGIDLGGAPHRGATWQGEAYDGRGNSYLASTIKLKNGANRTLFTYLAGDAPHQIFRNIIFDGNQNQQSANEYLVKSNNDLVTAYPYGMHFEWCHFNYGRGGGIYLGERRGWNYISNCSFYENGLGNNGHGIYISTYDVSLHNIHIGNCGGYGLYLDKVSQLQANFVNSYFNQLGGAYIGANCADVVFTNCSIDRNLRYGLNVVAKASASYDGLRSFVNTRFLANSTLTNGGFPDVMVGAGCTDLAFIGCSFMGDEAFTGNKAAFAIQFADSAGRVRLSACRFVAKSRWSNSDWTNNYACLEGGDLPGFTDRALSATVRALTANGADALVLSNPASATSHVQISGDAAGNPFILSRGAAANIGLVVRPKGTGTLIIGGGSANQLQVSDTGLGFYGTGPQAKPTVTGSRGANVALANLLTALSARGLITDSTSA